MKNLFLMVFYDERNSFHRPVLIRLGYVLCDLRITLASSDIKAIENIYFQLYKCAGIPACS